MNPLPAPSLLKGREEGKSGPPALKGRARKTSPKEKIGKSCSVLQDGPETGSTGRAGKESLGSYAILELWASFAQTVKICPKGAHSSPWGIQEMSKLLFPEGERGCTPPEPPGG